MTWVLYAVAIYTPVVVLIILAARELFMSEYKPDPFKRIELSINEIRQLAKELPDGAHETQATAGRATSETGGEKEQKPETLGAIDPTSLRALGRVAWMGQHKYSRFNYLKGYKYSWSIDAAYRHFLAFQQGEDRDPESGEYHVVHAAWHMLALTSFMERGLGTDDRFKQRRRGGG